MVIEMTTRRDVLCALLSGIALSALPWSIRQARAATPVGRILSAVDDTSGRHFIHLGHGADATGVDFPVTQRCHGGCQRPGSGEAVIFDRRPGRFFHVLDIANGQVRAHIEAATDYHFFGHGAFSPDGGLLYATANHIPSGEGQICVYDARSGYGLIDVYPVGGIDPHEIRLMPDGSSLVIAMGGILTHPDYERIKLNLDTMQPAVVLMDRLSGKILQRHTPSNHQLSAHHLDVDSRGMVVVGYQYEGPEWDTPPLIGVLDSKQQTYREITFEDGVQRQLRNYVASVALDSSSGLAAITAPRGNLVAVFDYSSGTLQRLVAVPDVAGVLVDGETFVVSSGRGGLYRVDPQRDEAVLLGSQDQRWDNHLTRIGLA
ncbi:hypothetical protein SAMN05216421_1251 [Halopseudomonas xinjiangensis]|uniref:DUF1513 domain-containing protein n=2 Tax=Halopseudomonas xinjiangensis TaxID=487184 RepID=A0A1H1QZT2_9GAMM|nr:hypothetical protein SAMN05216421_1251 [Halopseudomonas xinjiangensis]